MSLSNLRSWTKCLISYTIGFQSILSVGTFHWLVSGAKVPSYYTFHRARAIPPPQEPPNAQSRSTTANREVTTSPMLSKIWLWATPTLLLASSLEETMDMCYLRQTSHCALSRQDHDSIQSMHLPEDRARWQIWNIILGRWRIIISSIP